MKGLKYILRFLAGESPESIIRSIPDDDLSKAKELYRSVDKSALNRAQRRRMEKQLAKLNR